MAEKQYYGIKYPFSSDNLDEIYLDLNETQEDSVKSKILHILFTPKGDRLRNPDFGTDILKYIFEQNDDITMEGIILDLSNQIKKYVQNININDITIYEDENSEHGKIVIVKYSVTKGNTTTSTSIGVKI